jgi:fibronectin-binding autotransporter adhesin
MAAKRVSRWRRSLMPSNAALAIERKRIIRMAAGSAIAVGSLAGLSRSAWAANGADTWQGNTSVNWQDANWSPAANNPPISGDSLVFGTAGSKGSALNDNLTATNPTFIAITFNATGSAYTITGNSFVLGGNITDSFVGTESIGDSFSTTAVETYTTVATGTLTLGGAINGTGGGITTAGAGTLTLGGADTETGATTIAGGSASTLLTLNLTGSLTGGGALTVGAAPASTTYRAILNIGGNLTTSGVNGVGGGTATTGNGAIYQTAGTLSDTAAAADTAFALGGGSFGGSSTGGYGYYNLSGGAFSGNLISIGSRAGTTSVAVMDVTAGTATVAGKISMSRGGGAGVLNITGGTVNVGNSTTDGLEYANITGDYSIVNVGGGAGAAALTGVTSTAATITSNAVVGTNMLNLLTNGTATVNGFVTSTTAANLFSLNFNGGTLKATGTNLGTSFTLAADASLNATVFNGGGTIDNTGTAISLNRPLAAPSGSGVTSTTIAVNSGAGYIGAPVVKITGGTATNGDVATAVANMTSDGSGAYKVASITITDPGNYSVVPTAVTFTGGGFTTAATVPSFTTGANTSGGVTFQGSGTTTLGVVNTYTGATQINGGAVALGINNAINSGSTVTIGGTNATGAPTLSSTAATTITLTSPVVVSAAGGGAAGNINPGGAGSIGSLSLGSTLTGNGGGLSFDLGISGTNDLLAVTGAVTLNANTPLNLNALSSFAAGTSTYDLINAASFAGTGTFTIGTHPVGHIGFSLSTSTSTQEILTVTAGNPISGYGYWTGAASTALGDAANNWNTGTNTSNFSTSSTGLPDADQVPSSSTDVLFTASNATPNSGNALTTRLDGAYSIRSLIFDVPAISPTQITSASVNTNGNTLTISGVSSVNPDNGNSYGLLLSANSLASGAITGSGTVLLSAAQTWANNNGTLGLTLNANVASSLSASIGTLTLAGTGAGGVTLGGVLGNGSGTLALVDNQAGVTSLTATNTYTGATTISTGTLNLSGVLGSGGGTAISNSASFVETSTGVIAGTSSVTNAAGTTTLGGVNTYTGTTTVTAGTLNVTGSIGSAAGTGTETIGNTSGIAVLNVASTGAIGTSTGTNSFNGAVLIGNIVSAAAGVLNVNSGAVYANNFILGGSGNYYADANVGAGTLTIFGSNRFRIGSSSGTSAVAIVNVGGASTVVSSVPVSLNDVAGSTAGTGGFAVFNMTGGTLAAPGLTIGGRLGQAETTIAGAAVATLTGSTTLGASTAGTVASGDAGRIGVLNLGNGGAGGVLATTALTQTGTSSGAGSLNSFGYVNFNGGTLKAASGATSPFFSGVTQATVFSPGGTIDNGGVAITIAQPLLAASGSGVTSGSFTSGSNFGTGYTGNPYVQISAPGGSGTPATGVANLDGSGNVTSITITNPGTGYSSAPTLALLGGGGTSNSLITTIATNAAGGITFQGSNTTTLSGTSSYAGATATNAGTLNVTGNIATSSNVNVNAGATLTGTGTAGQNITVAGGSSTPTQGTIDLTSAIKTITTGGLTLGGATGSYAQLNFAIGTGTASLINLGGGGVVMNPGGGSIALTNNGVTSTETETLISSTGPLGLTTGTGSSVGSLSLTNTTSLGFGLTPTLVVTNTAVEISIASNTVPGGIVYWQGGKGTHWTDNSGGYGNFTTDPAGTNAGSFLTGLPGSSNDLVFSTSNATNLTNTLGQNFDINGLFFAAGAGSDVGAVSIGSLTAGNYLQIEADGITDNSAYAITLQPTTLIPNVNEMWSNTATGGLIISAAVTGTATTGNTTTVTLGNTNSGTTSISGAISDGTSGGNLALAITNTGSGTTTLSGTNTYSGGTTLNSGILQISANTNIGTATVGAGTITLNGGTLVTTNSGLFTDTHALVVGASGGTLEVNSTGTAGTGQFFISTANLLTGSGTLTITGGGSLTTSGEGNVRAGATNSFSGDITLQSGGIFEYGVAGAVSGSTVFTLGTEGEVATNTVNNPSNVTVAGGTDSVISFENGGTGTLSGNVTLNANGVVGLRDWYAYGTATGGAITGSITGTGGLTVESGTSSGGTLALYNSSNNYSGGTTINASRVTANVSQAFGTGSIMLSGTTAQIDLASGVNLANALTIGSGAGDAAQGIIFNSTASAAATYSGAITINAAAAAGGDFASSGGTLTISGPVTSTVDVTSRSGTTILSNASNSFSSLTLQAGTIQLGVANAIPAGTAMDIANNGAGTLDLAGFNESLASIVQDTGTATVTNSGASSPATLTTTGTGTFAGNITDGASTTALNVNGGLLQLSGVLNTYSGGTTITSGKLRITNASASATGSGPVNINGGTNAIIAGTGISTGALTVSNGGRIAPGINTVDADSSGDTDFGNAASISLGTTGGMTLTTANLDLDLSGSHSSGNDQIITGGTMTLVSLVVNINELSPSGATSLDTTGPYVLITGATGTSFPDAFSNITTNFYGGESYTATYSSPSNDLEVSFSNPVPTPEPGSLSLLALAGLGLMRRRRKTSVRATATTGNL